jgi:hypothetical protein
MSNPTPPRPRGRPPGLDYPKKKLVRLRDDDAADLAALADLWRSSESEAMRKALREAANRYLHLGIAP